MAVSQARIALWGASVVLVILPHLSQGLLSDFKICGDFECESLMSRVQATRDYIAKDCRFLSFRQGETIFVYHKLTGKREDLWAGSIDRQFGYFPKDAVKEEQVYATNEKVVETQESDFFCMDEFGYFIDSSHLNDDDDDDDKVSAEKTPVQEEETPQTKSQIDDPSSGSPLPSEGDSTHSTASTEESDREPVEEHHSKSEDTAVTQEEAPEAPTAAHDQGGSPPSSWLGSSVTGWLGLTKEEEAGEGEEIKKTQGTDSMTSSMSGWLGMGGAGQPDEARDTESDSLASTMTGWLGFGGEKKTDSVEKAKEEDIKTDQEAEPSDTFRSRKMYVDPESSQLHEEQEEKKEAGTLGWLSNGLSNTLGFGQTNQEEEHKEDAKQEAEAQAASGSWFDLGINNMLSFGEAEKPDQRSDTDENISDTSDVSPRETSQTNEDKAADIFPQTDTKHEDNLLKEQQKLDEISQYHQMQEKDENEVTSRESGREIKPPSAPDGEVTTASDLKEDQPRIPDTGIANEEEAQFTHEANDQGQATDDKQSGNDKTAVESPVLSPSPAEGVAEQDSKESTDHPETLTVTDSDAQSQVSDDASVELETEMLVKAQSEEDLSGRLALDEGAKESSETMREEESKDIKEDMEVLEEKGEEVKMDEAKDELREEGNQEEVSELEEVAEMRENVEKWDPEEVKEEQREAMAQEENKELKLEELKEEAGREATEIKDGERQAEVEFTEEKKLELNKVVEEIAEEKQEAKEVETTEKEQEKEVEANQKQEEVEGTEAGMKHKEAEEAEGEQIREKKEQGEVEEVKKGMEPVEEVKEDKEEEIMKETETEEEIKETPKQDVKEMEDDKGVIKEGIEQEEKEKKTSEEKPEDVKSMKEQEQELEEVKPEEKQEKVGEMEADEERKEVEDERRGEEASAEGERLSEDELKTMPTAEEVESNARDERGRDEEMMEVDHLTASHQMQDQQTDAALGNVESPCSGEKKEIGRCEGDTNTGGIVTEQMHAEDPAESLSKDPAQDREEIPAEDPPQDPVEDPKVDLVTAAAEEPFEEPSEFPSVDPSRDGAEEPAEEPSKDPADLSQDPVLDLSKNVAEEPAEKTYKDPAADPPHLSTDPAEGLITDPADGLSKDPHEDQSQELSTNPEEGLSKDQSEEPSQDPTTDLADGLSDPSQEQSQELPTNPAEGLSKDQSEDQSQDANSDQTGGLSKDPSEDPSHELFTNPEEGLSKDPAKEPLQDPSIDPAEDPAEPQSKGAFGLLKNAFNLFGQKQGDSTKEETPPPDQQLENKDVSPSPSPSPSPTPPPVQASTPIPPPSQPSTETPHIPQTLLQQQGSHPDHLSMDETAVLTELFGRNKLQFLDYILSRPDASAATDDDLEDEESILSDIEALLLYHREALLAPSTRLSDRPQEDRGRTQTLIALQKLEARLGRARETFLGRKAGNSQAEAAKKEGEELGRIGAEDAADIKGGVKGGGEEDSVGETGGSPQEGAMTQIFQIAHQIAKESSTHLKAAWELLIGITVQVVSSLPDDIRPGPDLYGVPWELVIVSSFLGLVTILLFTCRCYSSVKSRVYRSRERWMAEEIAKLLDEKCKALETFSKCQQEYDELENSLRDSGVLAQTQKTRQLEAKARQLDEAKSELEEDLEQLKDELDQQREHRLEQEKRIAALEESMKTFEDETKDLQSQDEQAQTTLKVYSMNSDRLQRNLETAGEENALLQESNSQLRQQVEGWAERVSELEEEMRRCEAAHSGMVQDVANKDERIMSLTDRVLRMKAWDSDLGEEVGAEAGDENTNGTARGGENGKGDSVDSSIHLQKVQKLIYAAKLNADLKSVDEDKDRVFAKLNDEVKAKEDLQESIQELEKEKLSMQWDTEHYSEQVHRLQQKLQIMTEMYQENELKLHRLLTVEEKERLQKEEKLNKADKNIALAMEELNNYRRRAEEMEEELEKTKQSYQTQISVHEKKAHNNWLAARGADRELADIRRENALLRQKLTDTQFKLDTLDKDPYALDSLARPLPFRAERSPYGPSPLSRPASETRALLSPPTLMEGPPARLSPRVPRGPGEPPSGQGELERSGGPHSDSGSISPSWERDRRGPPPGPPGPLGPPGYMFSEPGPMFRRPPPPPGAMGLLPPPGSLPPLGPPLPHPRGLPPGGPPGPPHPADMPDAAYRENSLAPGERDHREPGERRTPPESDPRMGGLPPPGLPGGHMDGPFPRRPPFGPPPPEFYHPRGPGGPPMMPGWAPPPPSMMHPHRFPPHMPGYGPPMRPPPPDGPAPPSMGPPPAQQPLPSPPHSQSPDEHAPSPQDII